MINPLMLEELFQEYITNLSVYLPDGIIPVDIELLDSLSLNSEGGTHSLKQIEKHFHVFETLNKITLVNEKYVIWIVPENINNNPTTYTFIALNNSLQLKLELVFSASGVYNSSSFILKVLDRFLIEIEENEKNIKAIEDAS